MKTTEMKKEEPQIPSDPAGFFTDDTNQVPPADIVSYNELRSCADLLRMYKQGSLEIQPEFQRHVVWRSPSQTRFIDSLIKGLPIPSMCFSHDYSTQRWQVIDGLQRITSIVRFLSESTWRLSTLDEIDPAIAGKSVKDFQDPKSPLHKFYSRVQDTTIPITVIRCDYTKASHTNFLFTIFHRLNTGGMRLTNQEIRNCIYTGKLNALLIRLDENAEWRKLTSSRYSTVDRFQREELILRFFAFYDELQKYTGRLARFLNDYMRGHTNPDEKYLESKERLFNQTVHLLADSMFDGKPAKETATVLESLMFGVGRNLKTVTSLSSADMVKRYAQLKGNPQFLEWSSGQGLSDKEKVSGRLLLAEQIFSK